MNDIKPDEQVTFPGENNTDLDSKHDDKGWPPIVPKTIEWDTSEPKSKPISKQKTKPEYRFLSVFSEIPWEKYMGRMTFTGKVPKGSKTVNRSITLDAQELRIAEIILTENKDKFQTLSDVIRDVIRKGLSVDYEILIRRKGTVKHRGGATYMELQFVDEELAVFHCIEEIKKRVEQVLKDSIKNIAGRDKEWAEEMIEGLVTQGEIDYPGRGLREYFNSLLHEPRDTTVLLENFKMRRGSNK
uniref:Uncharacterized protein n=1 Tax=viral metagenome TaxID=1070528 RepID=A0A6M3JSZ0_9ZZZZ